MGRIPDFGLLGLSVVQRLATGYIEAGNAPAAIRWHERLSELRPNDPGVLNNLAWLLQERGELNEAEVHARSAVQLAPELSEAWDTLGVIHKAQRNFADAASAFEQALALRPDDTEAQLLAAEAQFQAGRTDAAREHLVAVAGRRDTLAEAEEEVLDDLLQRLNTR